MIKALRNLLNIFPCRTRSDATVQFGKNAQLIEKNGGRIDVHPTTLLNSCSEGYHVGMPFGTTLIADAKDALIEIGPGCRIHGTYIHAWKSIKIGKNVLIAAGTNIIDANGHSENVRYARFRTHMKDEPSSITSGDHVWIGMNCTILKGVEIGECAIIAAGAVVKNSIPAFCIAEGNPAVVVKQLNPEDALPLDYPMEELALEKGFYNY